MIYIEELINKVINTKREVNPDIFDNSIEKLKKMY